MITLAQISATFIAITAGFYTTKIISIVNDKSRIKGRIDEYKIESTPLREKYTKLKKEIDSLDVESHQEAMKALKEVILEEVDESHQINNLNDAIKIFKLVFPDKSELNVVEILKELLPELINGSNKILNHLIDEGKKIDYTNRSSIITPDILVGLNSREKERERILETVRENTELLYYDDLTKQRDTVKERLFVLDALTKLMNEELKNLILPRKIRFGFISFIIFTGLGVFVPLLYNTWNDLISKYLILPIENNILVLILFTIGLTLNFVYMGLELQEAIKK